jgi:predicted nucleic acid-binding protein
VILVDSDVLIAHLRGNQRAHAWLRNERAAGPLTTSAVCLAEITGGMRSSERQEFWRLLSTFSIQPVTEQAGRRAGELMRAFRRSHGSIGLGDYLIAATCDVQGLDLATLNVKHFPMFKGLKAPFSLR